jgi:hypothetical protein
MTVLTDDMPHLESASLGIWVKAGSRSETEAEHGISHMLEHMAFKGTKTRSSLEIAARPSRMSAATSTPRPRWSTPAISPACSRRTWRSPAISCQRHPPELAVRAG